MRPVLSSYSSGVSVPSVAIKWDQAKVYDDTWMGASARCNLLDPFEAENFKVVVNAELRGLVARRRKHVDPVDPITVLQFVHQKFDAGIGFIRQVRQNDRNVQLKAICFKLVAMRGFQPPLRLRPSKAMLQRAPIWGAVTLNSIYRSLSISCTVRTLPEDKSFSSITNPGVDITP